MKTIIQETLASKQGKDKFFYFIYAYKGYFISIIVAIAAILFILFGYLTRPQILLSVKVITNQNEEAWLVPKLKKEYDELLRPSGKAKIDIEYINLNDSQQTNLLMAQLAANEIDMIWVSENKLAEFTQAFDQADDSKTEVTIEQKGTTFNLRIFDSPPHQTAIDQVLAETKVSAN